MTTSLCSGSSIPQPSNQHTQEKMLRAALACSETGIPVFPCYDEGKKPRIKDNLNLATTDRRQVRKWFQRWPRSNIGVPTGQKSGYISFDLDTYKPGAWGPEDVERELGELPGTKTIRTGSGGTQRYYRLPESEELRGIAENVLGPGVCVKADGGYVLVPPSRTKGVYKVIDDSPIADIPAWLLDRLRRRAEGTGTSGSSTGGKNLSPNVTVDLDGKIPYGSRNDTLTQIAGKLHNGRPFDQLLIALEATNQTRCEPPIGDHPDDDDPDEVARIARSIFDRQPCRKSAPSVGPEVVEELERIAYYHLWALSWKGRKLLPARSVFVAIIQEALKYGTLIPAGVRVSLSYRALALAARVSYDTAYNAVQLLRGELGVIRKDDYERPLEHSGAFVLVSPEVSGAVASLMSEDSPLRLTNSCDRVDHSNQGEAKSGQSDLLCRTPRLRATTPGSGKRKVGTVTGTSKVRQTPKPEKRETLQRLGKKAEFVIDVLQFAGAAVSIEALARVIGGRKSDLMKADGEGLIDRLIKDRLVRVVGDMVALVPDWLDVLEDVRERTGEREAHNRAGELYAQQAAERWRKTDERDLQRCEEKKDAAEDAPGWDKPGLEVDDTVRSTPEVITIA